MTQVQISMAKNMRSGIDVNGQITKLGESRNVNLKVGGTVVVTDATLTDDSGEMTTRASKLAARYLSQTDTQTPSKT